MKHVRPPYWKDFIKMWLLLFAGAAIMCFATYRCAAIGSILKAPIATHEVFEVQCEGEIHELLLPENTPEIKDWEVFFIQPVTPKMALAVFRKEVDSYENVAILTLRSDEPCPGVVALLLKLDGDMTFWLYREGKPISVDEEIYFAALDAWDAQDLKIQPSNAEVGGPYV